ncbi:flagellin [uncultured Oscillibacter sp.]|uniref:flagellin N-terminal helical domain-containing protein n=2 Tax=uncultured Oscillibacter sp. TaxID=876091 RepID=UPI0025E19A36|nr:flagellin [uncultured Oscillibacter sp.]
MRIQHNIMAMNAYRNYNTNTSALSKNLEKLSSGYKINRAGDDAAGLAISEKMRAQITGLNAAQKNVKDGISLVKTAEGAMQEIQDMLNRMDYLATQSANGTYDDPVDRKNLQKEVTALRDEINRIADSANFNGIKLLDGSLASTGTNSSAEFKGWDSIKGTLAAGLADVEATKTKDTILQANMTAAAATGGEKFTMSIAMSDGKTYDFEITAKLSETDNTKFSFVDKDGNELVGGLTAAGGLTDANIGKAFEAAIKNSELGKTYNVDGTTTAGKIVLEAKEAGAGVANVASVDMQYFNAAGVNTAFGGTNKIAGPDKTTAGASVTGEDAYQSLDLSNALIFKHTDDNTSLEKAVFEINGEKFVFVENGKVDDDAIKQMREAGIEHWVEVGAVKTIDENDVAAMVEKIKHATGLDVKQGTNTAGVWADDATGTCIKINDGTSSKAGGGLTLQIGDTADQFNQLRVNVGDMHTNAMGTGKTTLDGQEVTVNKTIADIDIGKLEGAQEAIGVIRNAINYVSEIRGDLGAVQNRLEHTQKNLSVMAENIQDAESTIRDTDVAEEMMSYTKNNILIQSAQAMLAQANAVPQGVLQLLG